MLVYVQAKDGTPLMPTRRCGWVRRALRDGRAVVVQRTPFTIRLTYATTRYTQPVTVGIDLGSREMGAAAVREDGQVLYQAEIKLRTDIRQKMDRRRTYRRARRGRKTRYRKRRFDNRRRPAGWLPPSLRSKANRIVQEVLAIAKILLVTKVRVELAQFDLQALLDPDVQGVGYQQGPLYGWENVRRYIFHRDGYRCVYCRGQSGDPRLRVDHVTPRSRGGSNSVRNLATACVTCNHEKGDRTPEEWLGRAVRPRAPDLRDPAHVQTLRFQVVARIKERFPTECQYGYRTSVDRKALGLAKGHAMDAVAIACGDRYETVRLAPGVYRKVGWAKGRYRLTAGPRSERFRPTGPRFGVRVGDKVSWAGREVFIKGTRQSGRMSLGTLEGETVHPSVSWKKLRKLESAGAVGIEFRRGASSPL